MSGKKPIIVPETIVGTEGSSKRNIIRKTNRNGSKGGKKENSISIDDGSLYTEKVIDESDPNYDSEEETGFEYIPRVSSLRRSVAGASMTLTKYKKTIEPLIKEFFASGDLDDIITSILAIDAPQYVYEFVKRSINMSFDHTDRERELLSRLLSTGYPDVFSSNMIGKGFERLFELIDEIEKDAPAARAMLATYVSRAVIDEVLPPSFLVDAVVCNLGGDIIDHAKRMLSRDHAGAKIERGWGPGDGRPVEDMKLATDQLLQEYLVSGDVVEAARCIRELNSKQFYHEVVKRAVVQAIDKPKEQRAKMSELLAYLAEEDLLTAMQAVKGFNRLYGLLPDLQLDSPSAHAIVQEFTDRAREYGVLPSDFVPVPTVPVTVFGE